MNNHSFVLRSITLNSFAKSDSEYYENQSLGRRLIHLSVESMHVKDTVVPQTKALMLHWIRWLTCLQRLYIVVEDMRLMRTLLSHLPETMTTLILKTTDPTIVFVNIPDLMAQYFTKPNLNNLKRLFLENYYISLEFVRIINDSLLLERFGFKCFHMNSPMIMDLARRQTELTHLYILWSRFKRYEDMEERVVFGKLRILELHDTLLDTNTVQLLIRSMPVLKYMIFTFIHVTCVSNIEVRSCRSCQNLCFEILPSISSLKKLTINFSAINQTFVNNLIRFSNLYSLDLTTYWTGRETKSQLDDYNSYLQQIVDILNNFSQRQPKKLFKLKICKTFLCQNGDKKFDTQRNLVITSRDDWKDNIFIVI